MEKTSNYIIVVVRGANLYSNVVLRMDKITGITHKLHINPANSQEIKWIRVENSGVVEE